ncbi:cytochrome P450 [Suillus spraguei]|nr:cytochrome P450 [Suillus spraguei]
MDIYADAPFIGDSGDISRYRRQRKAFTPAFSNAAVRKLTSVLYDSAYKAKGAWDTTIESSEDANTIIEVQTCLDTIGIVSFSHDFGSLDGKRSSVVEANPQASAVNQLFTLFALAFPIIAKIPTRRTNLFKKLGITMEKISNDLLIHSRQEKDANTSEKGEVKSIIGLSIKSEGQDTGIHMLEEEVVAQSLLRPNVPYLDAVVHEILRLHPPFGEFTRVAVTDDVIPLSETSTAINRSSAIWGADAKEFKPDRWLTEDGISGKTREVQVLLVLVKHFVFEMRDRPDTPVEVVRGILPRPRVVGENGIGIPLRIRRSEEHCSTQIFIKLQWEVLGMENNLKASNLPPKVKMHASRETKA